MNLGKVGKDRITGFTGIIVGYVQYLTGCNQYLLVPKCKKGEEHTKPQGEWVDDSRVDILKNKKIAVIIDPRSQSTGFDIAPHAD